MKKLLKKILLRIFGKQITNKLRIAWGHLMRVFNLYVHNSEPIFINTNHPVLVISSDDWGSVFLKSNSIGESAREINNLAKILSQHKDSRGRLAILNAYINTALPDFNAIGKSGFRVYIFYPTYRDRPEIIQAWMDGCKIGILKLGFHGRDHFNHKAWLSYLRNNNEYFIQGFYKRKVKYGEDGEEIIEQIPEIRYFAREYIDVTTFPSTPISLIEQNRLIQQGITIFRNMFGFKPTVFVAPGYCFDKTTEKVLSNSKIFYLEVSSEQTVAVSKNERSISRHLRWGEKLTGGITVLIRNAHYDPDLCQSGWGESNKKSVKANYKSALIEIKRAFRRGEPCILSTHAQNYIGKQEKVALNLKGFNALLDQVVTLWPDVCFLSAEELGALISHRKGNKINKNLKVNLYTKDNVKKPSLFSSLFWTIYDIFNLYFRIYF